MPQGLRPPDDERQALVTATSSDNLLNVRDVADQLGVSERTVRRYIGDNKLRVVKLGDGPQAPVRVAPVEVERFLERGVRRGFVQRLRRAIDQHKTERAQHEPLPQ
jgi:excisionase family DNA binding protein